MNSIFLLSYSNINSFYQRNLCFYPQQTKAGISEILKSPESPAECIRKEILKCVIFICTFDPFGKGNYQYTFRALCLENPAFALEDGTTRIFFNTKGNLEEAPEELRELLQYIETNQPESIFRKQLDHEVKRAERNEKWRREYMKELLHDFDMKEEGRREGREEGIREGKEEGRQEGREEGRQKVNLLNRLLAGRNRTEDIIRSAQDAEYQKKLFEEFQI